MSIINFLDSIDTAGFSDEAEENFFDRKEALRKMGSWGKKMAVAALPLGAVSAFSSQKAMAQSNDAFVGVLNYALTLELLEDTFYKMGLDSGVIASSDTTVFQQISKHEDAHVTFLQQVITDLGGDPLMRGDIQFDFTAGGNFMPFENYAQFMALSQAFEDTGVRAYKGQAGNAATNDTILTAALQIHSVEARHASQVRRMRGLKGWITQDNRGAGMPQATQAVYDGEDLAEQAGVSLFNVTDVGSDNITEAWDEPLTMDEVNAIASLFIQQ